MRTSRRRLAVLLTAITVLVAGGAITAISAQAAAGCRVGYAISSQWTGGFGATVTLTNLGDPVTSWQVGWSFGAGQTVTQLWSGTHTQAGSQVTVRNAPYNGTLATNAGTSFGFNGSWTGSNPVPTAFTMNGVTCTGTTVPSSAPPSSPPPGDTQPPTVPGGARVSNLTCDSVTFAWNAATDNVGVAFYDIYHDGQQMTSVSGSTLSANLTVVPGATWGLYVNARDAAGNVSQASSTVTITPPQCQVDTAAPTAPSQLTGTAAGTTVTLRWTAATDNIGVRAYDVYRGATVVGTVSGNPPATTFIDSGLAASTTYQYYVRARDAAGNTGPQSNTVSVATTGGCTVCAVTQVATETGIPWGLVTMPDGSILYSRRDNHDVIRLNPATGVKTTLGTVPNVQSTDGEGGLLGLAIAPTYATDGWLYIMHTSPSDNRVVRIRVVGDRLDTSTLAVLVSGLARNKYHDGGRLRFGPDGKLYASSGDAQNGAWAQQTSRLEGKILRLNADGTVPADNPFGNHVWSYGHRNPQGLAFDSQGRLWAQEFGNSVMDETNLIERGGNYGWPSCEGTSGTCGTAGFIAPKRTYPTSEGSCSGIAVVRDVLYIACLRGARMYRAVISGTSLTNVQSYFVGTYGRLRTVEPSPTGGVWLTTSNSNGSDRILHVDLG